MAVNGGQAVEQCMVVLDELENLSRNAKRSWLRSDAVMIERQALDDHLQLLRNSIPDALVKAEEIVSTEAAIMAGAEKEAADKVAAAKAEAQNIVAGAQTQLAQLQKQIEQAQAETQRIQQENVQLQQAAQQKAQSDAQNIIAKAHEEATRIVNLGEQRAMELVKEEAVYQRAEVHANELVDAATAEAEQLRQKTYSYLDNVLGQIEEYAGNLMADIHDQRDSLNGRKR